MLLTPIFERYDLDLTLSIFPRKNADGGILKRPHIVETEPFADTFGPKAQRKRPKIYAGTFEELGAAAVKEAEGVATLSGQAVIGAFCVAFLSSFNAYIRLFG